MRASQQVLGAKSLVWGPTSNLLIEGNHIANQLAKQAKELSYDADTKTKTQLVNGDTFLRSVLLLVNWETGNPRADHTKL